MFIIMDLVLKFGTSRYSESLILIPDTTVSYSGLIDAPCTTRW
jgi:hypothetical protein